MGPLNPGHSRPSQSCGLFWHTQRMSTFVQSFIDPDKWNAAAWKATAFLHDPLGEKPPCLGLVFGNIEVGKRIFSDWLERLGETDRYDELRISIVEGEILGEPSGYSVYISSAPDRIAERAQAEGIGFELGTATILGRFQRMLPQPGSPHLPRFKSEFAKHKEYLLLPVSAETEPQFEFAIRKTGIFFRQASEITKDDLDSAVFPPHYFDRDGTVH